jgi:hypothetical protein
MEPGEHRSIKDILASMERLRRRRDARTKAPARVRREPTVPAGKVQSKPPQVGQNGHCNSGKCATCAMCISNAKWEKVFNEKFADPDYYKTARPIRIGSSLSRLP